MEEAESYNFCCKTRLLSVEFVQPLAALDLQRDEAMECRLWRSWRLAFHLQFVVV
jgi:hypothetical protein